MLLKSSALVMAVLLTSAAASAAAADEPPPHDGLSQPITPRAPLPHERRLTLETTLGLGAPVGLAGIGVDLAVNRQLALSAGIGLGASGTQYALMGRRRWKLGTWSLAAGAGLSMGRYVWTELVFDNPAEKHWGNALWGNAEVALERRFDEYQVRWFAGVGSILNRAAGKCVGETGDHCEQEHKDDWLVVPYVGVALGWGWDL